MSQLHVELVAPDRKVWEGEASMVVARTIEGDLGVMPGHTPLVSVLADGEVHVETQDQGRQTAHVTGGFLSVDHDRVTIVADTVDASSFTA